jgi:integrase
MAEETGTKRTAKRLTAAFVKTARPGLHADGDGLYLRVDNEGHRRWSFISQKGGKRREIGLGSAREVLLAEARAKAHEARETIRAGRDPIAERKAARKPGSGPLTFGAVVNALLEAKEPEWRNAKHRAQWHMTLTKYAAPLANLPVVDVDTESVLRVLQPVWTSRPETASRLRGRIEAVLDYARAKGALPHDKANPARWKGHLSHLLPKRGKLSRGHHAAMPWRDVPGFVAQLRQRETIGARAFEFLILTVARTGEVLGAKWDEVNLETKVWTVSADRMKAGREHRVPLSKRALEIIEELTEARVGELIFPRSNMAFAMTLRRMGLEGVTAHGMRSAFRDWAGDATHFPRELAEAALAHVIGDKAEQAYRRSDSLEKRRDLMEAWARHCEPSGGKVVTLARRPS